MKTGICILSAMIITMAFSTRSESRMVHIIATSNSVWFPNVVTVEVGDTILFSAFINEIQHTTVCDGTMGTSRPVGADPWHSPVLSYGGFKYVIRVQGIYYYTCGTHGHNGGIIALITNASSQTNIVEGYDLSQNYPNPFNPSTKIKYSISKADFVKLKIYDSKGKEISSIVNEFKEPGSYDILFEAGNLSSGIYYYKLESGNFNKIKKMVLIK